MANANEFSQPVDYLNGGPALKTWGPFPTKEAACLALKNEVDSEGKNVRMGKEVGIGTNDRYIRHHWDGGYEDQNLVELFGGLVTKSDSRNIPHFSQLIGSVQNSAFENLFPAGNLPSIRYLSSNTTDNPFEKQEPTTVGLEVTGYTDNASGNGLVVYSDTGIPFDTLGRVFVIYKVNSLKSESPFFGFAFGSLDNISQAYLYRTTGMLSRSSRFDIVTFSTTEAPFSTGDTIGIEIERLAIGYRVRTCTNGVYGVWHSRNEVLQGNILLARRGTADYVVKTEVSFVNKNKEYTDKKINENLNFQYSDQSIIGSTPSSGVFTESPRTRLTTTPVIGSGQIKLEKIEAHYNIGGLSKITFGIKNQLGSYDFIRSFTVNAILGQNIFTTEHFGDNIIVPSGALTGFVSSPAYPANISGIVTSPGASLTRSDDAFVSTNQNFGDSAQSLQFRATFSIVENVSLKAEVERVKGSIVGRVYVSKSGSDSSGNGSKSRPYLTINKAISKAVGSSYTKIIIGGGDYREVINFQVITSENIELVRAGKSRVRILGSNKLSGFTKTAGRTNVYQASYMGSIATWTRAANPIFEDGRESNSIPRNKVHPLQKGLSHFLPFTPIMAQASIADVDANPGTYTFDATAKILYLHTSSSNNPETNGYGYEVPAWAFNTVPIFDDVMNRGSLKIEQIQFFYGSQGLYCAGFSHVERMRCTVGAVAGALVAGAFRDDISSVYSFRDEAMYSDGDGFNGHYNVYSDFATYDKREGAGLCKYIDPWSHHNFDDGMSHHERHDVSVQGGLFEYNGDRGFVPAQGCQAIIYNAISRNNGWAPDAQTGAGFEATNGIADGRYSTSLIAFGCVSEENKVGYTVTADQNNVLIANDCVSRNNSQVEYQQGMGTLQINNCTWTNANPSKAKYANDLAKLIINNDTKLI